MSKEAFIEAHEQLIAEYMDEHPDADEAKVYDMLADKAYDRMRDNLADRADYFRQLRKEGL